MSNNNTAAVIGISALAAGALWFWGRSQGTDRAEVVEARQDGITDRVEYRQDGRTERVQIRNETVREIWNDLRDNSKNSNDGTKYTTFFSPKKIQEVAVKLGTPNPYTYTPSGQPNYALTASINQVFTSTGSNSKNKDSNYTPKRKSSKSNASKAASFIVNTSPGLKAVQNITKSIIEKRAATKNEPKQPIGLKLRSTFNQILKR